MTMIEDRIRDVLSDQAAAMRVPVAMPTDQPLARVTTFPVRQRRSRVLIATAAAGLLIATGVALTQRRADDSAVGTQESAARAFRFEVPTVLLEAAEVEVTVADRSFVPPSDVVVQGDPGTPNEYTTLELTWHEADIEQRIYIYFTSDGTNWWADEIRTYDGNIAAEWIVEHGVFFESPLGSAFEGDLDLPNLKIHDMRLEAFLP